jgi:hypothetical protein
MPWNKDLESRTWVETAPLTNRCYAECSEREAQKFQADFPSNENKMSDGGRERASLGVKMSKSSQNVETKRSAVRSIAWLGEWRGSNVNF